MLSGTVLGSLLQQMVRLRGAKNALDIGCFTGYSALCIAEAMPEDGRVLSLERDEEVSGHLILTTCTLSVFLSPCLSTHAL